MAAATSITATLQAVATTVQGAAGPAVVRVGRHGAAAAASSWARTAC